MPASCDFIIDSTSLSAHDQSVITNIANAYLGVLLIELDNCFRSSSHPLSDLGLCLGDFGFINFDTTAKTDSIHTWGYSSVTKEPTFTEEGVKTYTCTVCGQTKDEVIPIRKKTKNVIYTSYITRCYSTKAQSFNLNAKTNGGARLSYKSNNKKVTVKNGKVTVAAKFSGTAKITITAADTDEYYETKKTITVAVPTITNVAKAATGRGRMTVQWKKNSTGKGYEVQYSTDKKFKKGNKTVKVKKNSTAKTTIKKLKKKTYYVRIRTINGKAYSDWSKTKTVKVK